MSEIKLKPCPFKAISGFERLYWVTKNGDIINADGEILKPYYNYCPNCGAKMDEEV